MEWQQVEDYDTLCDKYGECTPSGVAEKVFKNRPCPPILIPDTPSEVFLIDILRIPKHITTLFFCTWKNEDEDKPPEMVPRNAHGLDHLLKECRVVFIGDVGRERKLVALPEVPLLHRKHSKEAFIKLSKLPVHEFFPFTAWEREVIEDTTELGMASEDTVFWLRVPRKYIFDPEFGQNADDLERARNAPGARVRSTDACDMIQPEWSHCPPFPTRRFGKPFFKMFYSTYVMDECGVRKRRANGKPIVEIGAKTKAEEFAYTNQMPIYSYDLNDSGAKSYFCASDNVIEAMYRDRSYLARRLKDPESANCVSEVLMWRWPTKLYADLECYYQHNQSADGNEDHLTWTAIDFLNEQLASICKVDGVTREDWTILTADSRNVGEDGVIRGKVSRHGICHHPKACFRTMFDVKIFYHAAEDVLKRRWEEQPDGPLKCLEIMDRDGKVKTSFWDTAVVTMFRCFRLLGSDKYGAGRILRYHAGCKSENFELSCLIQRPPKATFEDNGDYICFNLDGQQQIGEYRIEYDENKNIGSVVRMVNGKRKSAGGFSTTPQKRMGSAAVEGATETQFRAVVDWLSTVPVAKPWFDRGSIEEATLKRREQKKYLFELPKVNAFCYRLKKQNLVGEGEPVHNSAPVILFLELAPNGSYYRCVQMCQSGKCTNKGLGQPFIGKLPESLVKILFNK